MNIQNIIKASISVKESILNSPETIQLIDQAVIKLTNSFKNNGQALFCGNGGSAADAQHIAAELSGKFYLDRKPLNAEALHVNSSYLTAASNDYNFDSAYSRIVEAKGRKGDVLVAISTSGNSKNIINAIKEASKNGLTVIGLTGETGGEMATLCDITIKVPSPDTPRIQESHILIGHIICELVEHNLFA